LYVCHLLDIFHIRPRYTLPSYLAKAQNTSTMADNGRNVDLLSIEANEAQHDAVLDYYGRRLATCSSDKTIKIFEVEGEKHTLVETLRGYVTTNYHTNTLLTAGQT
jgi:hypothetical protein